MFSKNFFKPQVVKFQRFSRKANAAFLSLHRVVNIGVVCSAIADMELLKSGRKLAVVSLMWSAGVAYATDLAESDTLPDEEALLTVQEDTATSHPAQVDLHEVVVASQRTELHSDSYRMVTQVSGAEISQLPIQTVSDVLKYLPGIDVRTRAANGGQSDVSMRGGTFDQVLVMINGVNLTDSQTGHYSMNLPIPADAIERIEVMQGTSSSLFCLNAFAGAINIVTRPTFLSDTTHCKAKLSGGMYGFANAAASLDWKRGAWTGKVSADYNRSDGYQAPGPTEKEKISIANTDLKCSNVYANAFYKDFELQIGAQYKDAGLGMAYGFGSLDQFDATRTIFGSVGYKHLWGRWGLVSVLSYRANYDRYEWHRGQRLYGNFHFLQTASAVVKTHYVSDFGKTSFGVELRNESLHSTNLGDTINPYGQVPNVEGFALKNVRVLQLVKGCNRLNVSYFVEQSVFCWEPFVASVGVSGNYNTLSGYNMSGGANLGYNYQKGSSVYLNTNRSLRLPTFTDLYYDAGNQLGNRDLLPEEAWTLSIGTKYANEFSGKGRLQFSADGYYRWGVNIIDWVYVPDDAKRPYHATNHNKVNATGLELAAVYRLNDWLPKVSLSYAYTYMDLNLAQSGSRYLDYLSHKLVFGLSHAIYLHRVPDGNTRKWWSIGATWQLSYRQREGEFNNAEGEICAYRPVLLLDGSIYWENRTLKVSADCTNMTNRHYYDIGGVLQPSAWAKLTVGYKW